MRLATGQFMGHHYSLMFYMVFDCLCMDAQVGMKLACIYMGKPMTSEKSAQLRKNDC
ncbi:MAG: hypothetical protein HYV35_07340 [Lentisphaerae bacterium]|nr:hypothetical protein [Lentisphaerota bacterium]